MSKRNATTPLRDRFMAYIRRRKWNQYGSFTRSEVMSDLHATDEESKILIAEADRSGLIRWDRESLRWRIVHGRKR